MLVLGLFNSSFLNGLNVSTILFEVYIVTGDKEIIPHFSADIITFKHLFFPETQNRAV